MSKYCYLLILFFSIVTINFANPIFPNIINEFILDTTGWKIEIYNRNLDTLSFDDCYLTSTDDTTYFEAGINSASRYIILQEDNFLSNFTIHKTNDTLKFYDGKHNYYTGYLAFDNNKFPKCPDTGQSLCLSSNGDGMEFYMDYSPTPGQTNDTIDATGNILFNVMDPFGEPLNNIYCYNNLYVTPGLIDITNINGQIKLNLLSDVYRYYFSSYDSLFTLYTSGPKQNSVSKSFTIYPKTTQSVNIIIPDSILTRIDYSQPDISINKKYTLSDNYPNPFNSYSTFTYQVPIDDYVEINLYDIQGRLVKTLESGLKPAGKYQVEFGPSNLSSGIFFYRLETANKTITKECMFLK